MVNVTSQRDLRKVRDLPFCHVCGRLVLESEAEDRDHVPPQACFDKGDRNPPLKLRCHVACNNANKLNDEKVGQLIAARRSEWLEPEKTHLQVRSISDDDSGRQYAALMNLDIDGAIRRWIGGFHAALYKEPLPPGTPFAVTSPLPKATETEQGMRFHPIPEHHQPFVKTIKLNRAARNVDTLITNADKLRYECVWANEDNGQRWFCTFALDIYDWIKLGDMKNFDARGCVGAYMPGVSLPPVGACVATQVLAELPNAEPLNPFGK